MFLINIIKFVHLLLLIFVLVAPFYPKKLLLVSIIMLIYIYYKWKTESSCILTKIEYILLGREKEEQGFIYRIINPIYNISDEKLQEILEYATFGWIIILGSIYYFKFFEFNTFPISNK